MKLSHNSFAALHCAVPATVQVCNTPLYHGPCQSTRPSWHALHVVLDRPVVPRW